MSGQVHNRFASWARRWPRRLGDGAGPVEVRAEPAGLGEWLDVPFEGVGALGDAIARIYDGALDGMTIRGVFSESEMARAVVRARAHAEEFRDHGEQVMFGTALVGAEASRDGYYADAARFADRLDEMFDGGFTSRIERVLSSLGAGRPAVVPEEQGRGRYVPATVRFLPPGRGVMHGHTANEFCGVWDAYAHLRDIARMWNSLSYFVVGEAPDEGGELELYDLMWDDTPDDIRALGMSQERDDLLARFRVQPIRPGVGDMIVFTGGRIWHRVAPVRGERERITIGGFVALSTDDRETYYWS